ncbi:hypothetical protein [Marinobacter salarius]|uniref:hypothetical protein n=1 Tax=Marinobacter salarius TaxID=1420917 RepID=UPI0025A4C213|nr:hypothetical protein [Marinobacter salarius]MDM8181287.1 hypothetical protein [Marinobacter salarius]|tara:strand:+ start:2032 stop:2469 length:438 start_codon:yes stop_codon:yes gene_type:complete
MRRVKDTATIDIFEVPQPVVPAPGSGNYAAQVSELVGSILKSSPHDRYEIAAQMSRLSGDDVSKHMLDAWSSPGRSEHNIPLYRVPLLEEVCQSHAFTDWLVHLRGGRVAYGREALAAQYGKMHRMKDRLQQEMRELKRLMGEEE